MAKKTPTPVEKPAAATTAKKPSLSKAKDQPKAKIAQAQKTIATTGKQSDKNVKGPAKPPKAASTAAATAKPKVESTKKVKPTNQECEQPKQEKRGRPSLYTPEIAAEICRRMAEGESVRKIGEDENMPHEATIRGWALDDKEGFFTQYTRAVQIRAMRWAEETVEISDDGSNDTYIDPETGEERVNHEIVARSRLRVDTRKWITSKVLPKIYGDKLDVNHGVQPENPMAKLFEQIAGTSIKPAGPKK